MRRALVLVALAGAGALAACGSDDGGGGDGSAASRPYARHAGHIHGLGVNPADGSLVIATHSGLFRSPAGTASATALGASAQDTMGFTVTGPNEFLGSGHPAPGEDGPPNLGLIRSADGGKSWEEVSLGGQADFHVLRYAHDRVYGFNGLSGELMISDNGGESWETRQPPAPLFDLAIDPADPGHLIGASEVGLIESVSGGEEWEELSPALGLLAWPAPDRLYMFDGDGVVSVSSDQGSLFRQVGRLPEAPVAVLAKSGSELFAALGSGVVLTSSDGGETWTERVAP